MRGGRGRERERLDGDDNDTICNENDFYFINSSLLS